LQFDGQGGVANAILGAAARAPKPRANAKPVRINNFIVSSP